MDYLEVNQPGGFPLTTNILNHIQNAASIFQAFGQLAGDFSIISGCEEIGSTVKNGVVYFNGEIFPFKGGPKMSKVRIIEINETKNFEDGTTRAVVFKRYVEFGTTTTDYLWSNFQRVDPLITLTQKVSELEKTAAVFTKGGGMVLWQKPANEIPEGWQEVVNWRGRIPVGFDAAQSSFNSLGKEGGTDQVKIKKENLPIVESNIYGGRRGTAHSSGKWWEVKLGSEYSLPAGTKKFSTSDFGAKGVSLPILNPYRVVMFIERI